MPLIVFTEWYMIYVWHSGRQCDPAENACWTLESRAYWQRNLETHWTSRQHWSPPIGNAEFAQFAKEEKWNPMVQGAEHLGPSAGLRHVRRTSQEGVGDKNTDITTPLWAETLGTRMLSKLNILYDRMILWGHDLTHLAKAFRKMSRWTLVGSGCSLWPWPAMNPSRDFN